MMRIALVASAALACAGCGDGKAKATDAMPDAPLEGYTKPDLVCPGDPRCASRGDGVLKVGAAKRTWTPTGFETYTDANQNRKWDASETYTDLNHNHKFDAIWLFGGSRAALGVATEVEARAMAFVEGDETFVVVYNDCIGMLAGDMDAIRADPRLVALDIDHILIGSTHAHDAPDIVGLWGPDVATTGREDFVVAALEEADVAAIAEAVQTAVPAQMTIASTLLINDPADRTSRTDHWNKDIRDPVIMDPTLTAAKFTRLSDGAVIGTLVNWGNHPEVMHFDNSVPAAITAHYPHWLREGVENGVTRAESIFAGDHDLPGLGGVTVFVQGALGGQIGSLRGSPIPGPNGTPLPDDTLAKDRAIGVNVAAKVLTILASPDAEVVTNLPLGLRTMKYNARIDNTLFHVAFLIDVLGPHELVGYDKDQPIEETNLPWLPLRATYLQIGPLGIETAPGELDPELWVGGYDGSWSWGWPLIMDAGKCSDTGAQCNDQSPCAAGVACVPTPNLPRLAEAPKPPYMRDLVLAQPGVKYPVLAGLAEDYIGYIIPAYNYALDPEHPYLDQAAGDHYEEVYSLGPLVEQHAVDPILQFLQDR